MNQKKRLSVKTVVLIGMLGALAAVLETFQIPVPFAPPFYKLDFCRDSDHDRRLCPGAGPGHSHGAGEKPAEDPRSTVRRPCTWGDLGNFIGGCAFVLPASILYQKHRTRKMAMAGLGLSVFTGVLTAIVVNCFLTLPLYANPMFGGIEKYHLHGNGH